MKKLEIGLDALERVIEKFKQPGIAGDPNPKSEKQNNTREANSLAWPKSEGKAEIRSPESYRSLGACWLLSAFRTSGFDLPSEFRPSAFPCVWP